MCEFQSYRKSKTNQISEMEKRTIHNTSRNEYLNQNQNHHGDGSVLPSNEFPDSQSCPYCLQKHLPVYTTCASPPQLVRPHRTYLTPDSPFSPLGPEGPSIPAFPLRPISPEIFSFHLIFFVFPSQRLWY